MNRVVVCGLQPTVLRTESASEDALLQRDAHNFADWYATSRSSVRTSYRRSTPHWHQAVGEYRRFPANG